MLYATLKLLFRLTIRVFFRKVHLRNLEQVPATGPLIVCANHPSGFMDPIVVAVLLNRPVFFLAKASAFKTRFAQFMMRRLHIVPVYRKQDDPSLMHKNQEMFEKCFEHLGHNGALLIFPEGTSITERKLREIKTGAARIALGAEQKYGYKLGVQIVTVGLNYNDPHRFRDEVFVYVDKPIAVSEYTTLHATDETKAVDQLTDRIRESLEQHMISIGDGETDALVHNIEKLYKQKLLRDRGFVRDDKEKDFQLTRRIVETVAHYSEKDPARVERMREAIDRYLANVKRIGINDRLLDTSRERSSRTGKNIAELTFVVFGFPFFLYGAVFNILPYLLVRRLRKISGDPQFEGSIALAAGMIVFLLWYILIGVLSWKLVYAGWPSLLFTASLLPLGTWAFYYYIVLRHIGKRWFFASLFYKHAKLIAELIVEREAIISEFDKAADEFRAQYPASY